MKELAMLDQLSFEDCFNFKKIPKPKLANGEIVYIRILDTVVSGKVNRNWVCGEGKGETYFGYDVDLEYGMHDVVWDYLIGNEVFLNEKSAIQKAKSLLYEKINPKEILLDECKSFEYYRELDGHRLTATIAKIGETQLYEHNFMCYHFIRSYPNKLRRDKAYTENLSKIIEEVERHLASELQAPALDVLYKVNASLYASIGYAKHNGVKAS